MGSHLKHSKQNLAETIIEVRPEKIAAGSGSRQSTLDARIRFPAIAMIARRQLVGERPPAKQSPNGRNLQVAT